MATRRIVTADKSGGTAPEYPTPSSPATSSNITPAVPPSIIFKLLFFTGMMVTLPITSFFVTRDYVFAGNSTYAGATAAAIANVVLIGYVIVAVLEDQGEPAAMQKKDGKGD